MPGVGCHQTRIVAVHGDADPLDPYRGGPDGRPGYPAIPPAGAAIIAWADLGGGRTGTTDRVAPDIVTTTYTCGATRSVVPVRQSPRSAQAMMAAPAGG